ncbi:hypothetical protein ABT072_46615 [Streptomyces sp. NPDC002589]|uniref:hypothetical protein n=1 Tax=Streptomyces sp. NPDC002589 TaxID=3154420 RepID=UPI0033282C35
MSTAMPKDQDTAQQRARELQQAEDISYQTALKRVRAEASAKACAELADETPAPVPAAVAYVLEPTAAEAAEGITAEELGVRALPADASPELRAHAEAVWRSEPDPGRRCRCSGTKCYHGERCEEDYGVESAYGVDLQCEGRLVHVDRHPGSMFEVRVWYDLYRCDTCGEPYDTRPELPDLPWGDVPERSQLDGTEQTLSDGRSDGPVIVMFDGIRHPNFPDHAEEPDPDLFHVPAFWAEATR